MSAPEGEVRPVAVWDWPVRITHWAIAVLFALQWWTGETGKMDWHVRFGVMALGLVVFRLLWGLFGSSTARFAGFVRGPRAVWGYAGKLLRGAEGPAMLGHNPLGAVSIVAMLGLLAAQVVLGLVSVDVDGINSGPWASKVSFEQGRWAANAHELVFKLLLALTAVHLAAVVFYLAVRRENLVGPMLSGRRRAPLGTSAMTMAAWWKAAACVAAAFVVMWVAWSPPG